MSVTTGSPTVYQFNYVEDSNETYIFRLDGKSMSVSEMDTIAGLLIAFGHQLAGGHEHSISVVGKISNFR